MLYTNASTSALIDPNNFTVDVNGQMLGFAGLGLKAPTSSVPEAGTLALFGAGLIGLLAFGRRRSRPSRG